jgi:hypothetical protein
VADACAAADALTAEIIASVSGHFAGASTAGDFFTIARELKDRAEASLRVLTRLERQLLPPRQNPKALYWATALGVLALPAGFIPVAGRSSAPALVSRPPRLAARTYRRPWPVPACERSWSRA